MYVEPSAIQHDVGGIAFHGCGTCRMRCITLVLWTDNSERVEYTLLTCARVAIAHLMDLYCLYRGIDSPPGMGPALVTTVTTLHVEKIVSPDEWLTCLKWTQYRRLGTKASLEWFVARSTAEQSAFYYSVGGLGTLLVSREDPSRTLKINKETVQLASGTSFDLCSKPIVCRLKGREETEKGRGNFDVMCF